MDVSPKQVTDSSIASIADEECPLVKDSAQSSQAKGLFRKSGSDASLPFYFNFVYYAFNSGTPQSFSSVSCCCGAPGTSHRMAWPAGPLLSRCSTLSGNPVLEHQGAAVLQHGNIYHLQG